MWSLLRIDLTIISDFRWDKKIHSTAGSYGITEDVDEDIVIFYSTFMLLQHYTEDEHMSSLECGLQGCK